MAAGSALGALGILLLNLSQQILQFKASIPDLGSIGHDSVPHGLVDDLDLVELVHRGRPQNLIVRFANVKCHELHLAQVAHDVDVVPSLGDSREDQRVVELPGPEEGDVVDWEFFASHVEPGH